MSMATVVNNRVKGKCLIKIITIWRGIVKNKRKEIEKIRNYQRYPVFKKVRL